jgi:hypothetical protein
MPIALHSWIIEKDGGVRVRHTFFAETEEEADRLLKQHAGGCSHFGPADAAGETIEVVEDIDDLPDAETLEDMFEEDDYGAGDDDEEEEGK